MANYATLKTSIQNVVKTNGNNEITGALLQQSLLSMINSLGANYQFAGVATPSTNPGTPDQNVFYIASTPGDYSNFGTGNALYAGEIAIFVYNGSWTKLHTSIGSNAQVIKVVGKGATSDAAGITGVGQVFYNTTLNLFRICVVFNGTNNQFETIYPGEHTVFLYNGQLCLWDGTDFVPIEQNAAAIESLRNVVIGGDVQFGNHIGYQITSNNAYGQTSAPNGCRFAEITPGGKYLVTTKHNVATIIAILQNIDNMAPNNTPAFSTQYPSRIIVAANEQFDFICPSDAHYLYMIDQPNSSTYDLGNVVSVGLVAAIEQNTAAIEQNTAAIDILITTDEYSKSEIESTFEIVTGGSTGAFAVLMDAENSIGKTFSSVTRANSTGPCYLFKIPIPGKCSITYPLFKTSSGYGCLVADANNIIIDQYANSQLNTGSLRTFITPENAAFFYFSAPNSLSSLNTYTLKIVKSAGGSVDTSEIDNLLVSARIGWLPFLSNLSDNVKTSLNLAGIRFEYVANKIPFQRGYLFHKNKSDDRTIFYGTKLDNAQQVGTLDYYPNTCVIGVSSKDGTVIGVGRDTRAAIHVFQNGQNYTVDAKSSDGNNTSPKGWLYNSGCEFIPDGTNEYCIFAEYDGSVSDNQRLYIWKGTYPYTSPSNWKTVYYKTTSYNSGNPTPGSITHWHMIRRDPWTGIIYCTSGDFTGQFFWIYSTDNGETWNELASDSNTATKPSWVLDGQPLRCINFIFTKDYIYFATDHGSNNTLSRIRRGTNGLIDLTTREILATLPYGIAVNSLCYVESPNGLFMFTRIDTGFPSEYSKDIPVLFWSFVNEKMYTVARLKQLVANWGGHRGKCYFNYTNGQETRPAMGFASNTPCGFDLIGADGTAIGTIYYEL